MLVIDGRRVMLNTLSAAKVCIGPAESDRPDPT